MAMKVSATRYMALHASYPRRAMLMSIICAGQSIMQSKESKTSFAPSFRSSKGHWIALQVTSQKRLTLYRKCLTRLIEKTRSPTQAS